MSICDNTIVNQETSLKLQSIRKTKTCRNACKKIFNDPRIRWSTAVLYKKKYRGTGTRYQVTILKQYRGTVTRYFSTRYCPPLVVQQCIETEEILCIVVLDSKCSSNITLYAILCDINFTYLLKTFESFEVHETM